MSNLRPRVRQPLTRRQVAAGALWQFSEAVEALGCGRSTLHYWRRRGRVIALHRQGRVWFPAEQFDGPAPLIGIDDLLKLFGSGEATWQWLDRSSLHLAGSRPIRWLREGKLHEVLEAAIADITVAPS